MAKIENSAKMIYETIKWEKKTSNRDRTNQLLILKY